MIQHDFANRAKQILAIDENVIGLAAGGSFITNELDEFSDLDLILVTKEKVSGDSYRMLDYAKKIGNLLSGFTGEHVGEPRVLICLYDQPLLHVDIKFLILEEFYVRIETPVLLIDKGGQLENVINLSEANYPYPDFQYIEDRFWIWIHYALQKIGRGEYLEAYDFLGYLRMAVFGPLLHIKNGNLPRGLRRVETELSARDVNKLKQTIPIYQRQSLLEALSASVKLYLELRKELFDNKVQLQTNTESTVMKYFNFIENHKRG